MHEAIGAGRGNWQFRRSEQCLGHWMRWNAHANGVAARRDQRWNARAAWQHQGQWARPEAFRQPYRFRWDGAGYLRQVRRIRQVDDQGVAQWTLFGDEDALERRLAGGVGS